MVKNYLGVFVFWGNQNLTVNFKKNKALLICLVLPFFISNSFAQTTIATENWTANNYTTGTGWTGNWLETDDDGSSATGKIFINANELDIQGPSGEVNIRRQEVVALAQKLQLQAL